MKSLLERIEMFTEEKDSEYEKFFKNKLKKYGVDEPDELSKEEKKKFFSEIEREWTKDDDHEEESDDEDEKKDKKKKDSDDDDDLDENLDSKALAIETMNQLRKMVKSNTLTIGGQEFTVDSIGKFTGKLVGAKGATYLVSSSPRSKAVEDEDVLVFSIAKGKGPNLKQEVYGIKDNKIIKLYKGL